MQHSPTAQPPTEPSPAIVVDEKENVHISISLKFIEIFAGAILIFALVGAFSYYFKQRLDGVAKTYAECLKSPGSRLQESFPAICITTEGNYFVQELSDEDKKNLLPPLPTSPAEPPVIPTEQPPLVLQGCKRAGCSGQLCVDSFSEDIMTTCEYRAEYACYQEAPCERQPDGACGFTPSDGLTACLEKSTSSEEFIRTPAGF
jgi:hypothetical protein